MSASPETRAARKTRGGFACCSRRATHTQSEAGDVQTDPLSPIKPEEAAEATVLVVEAVIAEEGEATVDVEPEDATPDVSRASTPVSAASTVSFAEHAGLERSPRREGSSLDGLKTGDVFDEDVSVDATDDDDDDEKRKTRAVAAALASSIMAEADDAFLSDDLDVTDTSDVAARDRDVASDVSFCSGLENEERVTFEDANAVEKIKNADETTPLLRTNAANGDARVDADAVDPEKADLAMSAAVSSTSEDEKALLVSVHGVAKRRRDARMNDSASFAEGRSREKKKGGFFARNFSAKSAVLAATTFAVCAACTAGVLTLRFATPRATVVVGPDAEALAASENLSPPSRATKRSGAREEAKKHAPSSAKTDIKSAAAKTRASKTSRRDGKKHASKSSSKSSSSSSPPSAKRTAHVARDADADDDVSSLGLLPRGPGPVACVSALGEARHGVHMQVDPDAAGSSGGAACKRCYLKGTPAETQKGSMGWCRSSVCERLKLENSLCAPDDKEPLASERERGTSDPPRRTTRRHGPSGSAAGPSDVHEVHEHSSDGFGAKREKSGSSSRGRARRVGGVLPSDDFETFSFAASETSTTARSEDDDETASETTETSFVPRRVGRCVAEPGDADFGRYVWEDPSCGSNKKHSGPGCVDLGTHHCRFCVAEVRDGNDAGELGSSENRLATCPRDVCDVHNLFWELCEET